MFSINAFDEKGCKFKELIIAQTEIHQFGVFMMQRPNLTGVFKMYFNCNPVCCIFMEYWDNRNLSI
jgi:hypothetical protein